MKQAIYNYLLVSFFILFATSCEDLEQTNIDPNNPTEVHSNMLFSGTQKRMIDYVYDNWFGGRQCLVYSQYWAQRNYTEEDRYQVRESVNNNYFNYFYTSIAGMDGVIALNTDPETAPSSAVYGANNNQIAVAKIMKVWMYSVITDTWGNVPYSETGKLKEGIYYPKYDDQKDIYTSLIQELTDAANMINISEPAFNGGDMIYYGDASKWKKFANSLKCRLAIHLSKVDPNWKTYITEAISAGVFESNNDVAAYHYSATSPEYSMFYEGTFIDARNDFTITRTFMNILKGVSDTNNNKTHPWEGIEDPRLKMFTTPGAGENGDNYIGIPYGITNGQTAPFRAKAPDWGINPPAHLNPDFPVPLMTYAEMLFIRSEYNGFSNEEYQKGIEASIDYWASVSGQQPETSNVAGYLAAVKEDGATPETVALQKYIDLYLNGTEAWTEIRRTGYPEQLIKPGEISVGANENNGTELRFTALSETKGIIIARVKYPTNESTLNGESFNAAVQKLEDGTNNYYSPMYWDVRRKDGAHPENK
ncbi:hypothetical protein EZS27_019299 [termite gut metagenome]|uniref:SusD/RagB family nutrient-binding outer membrane lipoprotein n=1 Tax=termite gut metagenome TaxID=433724 RepID=A0A5J4RDJ1_9ZZZZ